jgi:hypothetical protein
MANAIVPTTSRNTPPIKNGIKLNGKGKPGEKEGKGRNRVLNSLCVSAPLQ